MEAGPSRQRSFGGHVQAHPGAPPRRAGRPDLFGLTLPMVAAEAFELVGHHAALQAPHCGRCREGQVATARAVDPGDGAQRVDAVGRRLDDLDGLGMPMASPLLGHARIDYLAGQGIADEDHAPVVPGHTAATVRRGPTVKVRMVNRGTLVARHPAPTAHRCP